MMKTLTPKDSQRLPKTLVQSGVKATMNPKEDYDLLIIGGGIGGIISLYYAKKAGLRALVLERQAEVGGLWARLPAWQDIQNNPIDWTLGDLPIGGADQASILKNIRSWVDRFELAPFIRLNTPVLRAEPAEGGWRLSTPQCTLTARHLIAATGGHNRPFTPAIERVDSKVREFHSSALREPAEIRGKRVVVVGGGASAFDLLELCFANQAQKIIWVYRGLKWMSPTRKSKHLASDVRTMGRQQMLDVPLADINRGIGDDLRGRYAKFGIDAIRPEREFDISQDQLIPGRRDMIEHFQQIERHAGEIVQLKQNHAELANGQKIEADMLLWGTGYELDVSYLALPALAGITRPEQLARRCGSLFRALDAPNLFFLAPGLLESTSVTPWAYSHAARSIVAHIQGKAALGTEPVNHKLNYFDLAKFLATQDATNFPPDTWVKTYTAMVVDHLPEQAMPIP